MQVSFGADFEIEQRLERYAAVRLNPTPAATARLRARVMRDTRIAIAAGRLQAVVHPAVVTRRRAAGHRSIWRRAAGIGLAAALSIGAVSGVLAAGQPGGPLYDARVWLESLALPSDSDNRADAEIARLEARMSEVLAAARSGNNPAVREALVAYEGIADEALSRATGNDAALERILLALGRHLEVLTWVGDKVPDQASAAIQANIERAIAHSNATIERIQGASGGPDSTARPNDGKPAAKTQKPGATAKPADKTPKPAAATPRPTPVAATPAPVQPPHGPPSAKPGKTPPGGNPNQPTP